MRNTYNAAGGTPEVGAKLIERIRWWEEYTARNKGEMNNNPSPGNKEGGLSTILEKSLGAAAKGGINKLTGVYKYAEEIREKGFVFGGSVRLRPMLNHGQVGAGREHRLLHHQARLRLWLQTVSEHEPQTNTTMYQRMEEDMDINCGVVLDDGVFDSGDGRPDI